MRHLAATGLLIASALAFPSLAAAPQLALDAAYLGLATHTRLANLGGDERDCSGLVPVHVEWGTRTGQLEDLAAAGSSLDFYAEDAVNALPALPGSPPGLSLEGGWRVNIDFNEPAECRSAYTGIGFYDASQCAKDGAGTMHCFVDFTGNDCSLETNELTLTTTGALLFEIVYPCDGFDEHCPVTGTLTRVA